MTKKLTLAEKEERKITQSNFDLFRKRWNNGEYQSEDENLYSAIADDFKTNTHTAQRWVLLAKNGKSNDGQRKTKQQLIDIFNSIKSEGTTGKSVLEIAGKYGISHITAKKFITMIKAGRDYGIVPRKKTKVLLLTKNSSEKISSWPLLKVNVSPDVKRDFDHLPDRPRKQLFFNLDKTIGKLNIDQLPEVTKQDGVTSYHQINIRVSPESLSKWQSLPSTFKKNLWIDQLIANLCHSMLE